MMGKWRTSRATSRARWSMSGISSRSYWAFEERDEDVGGVVGATPACDRDRRALHVLLYVVDEAPKHERGRSCSTYGTMTI
jgi:hypothetical protein